MMRIDEGWVLEFFHDKRVMCAYCFSADASAVQCLSEEGKEHRIKKDKVLSAGKPEVSLGGRSEILPYLRDTGGRRQEMARSIELSELWELCLEDRECYRCADLAEIYFGTACGEDGFSAMFRRLAFDKLYFKRKDDFYHPQSREHVEAVLLQRRREEEKKIKYQTVADGFRRIMEDENRPSGGVLLEMEDAVVDVAVRGAESPRSREVAALFALAGITAPVRTGAFELLVKAGVFTRDENLMLRAAGVEVEVPAVFENLAAEAVRNFDTGESGGYEDLSHLEIVTIDGVKTLDLDDGVSLEILDGRCRAGVHITDVSAFIAPGTPLDELACRRATSIYLPDRRINMLPSALCEDSASLVCGALRPALSFFAELSPEGEVLSFHIRKTKIKVARRFSYAEADAAVAEKGKLSAMYGLARTLFEKRMRNGAFYLPFPRINITVEKGVPLLEKDDPERPSQILVSEFMILANSLTALFFQEKKIPALYRNQGRPETAVENCENPDPFSLYQMRRFMKRVSVDTVSAGHGGLGLAHYTQVTSPLRRYTDLILQRQLKHYLDKEEALYSAEELRELLMSLEHTVELADRLERDRKRYWLLKYLEGVKGEPQEALVLKTFPSHILVQIRSCLLELQMPRPAGETVSPGDFIRIVPETVSPGAGEARLAYGGKLSASAG